MPQKPSLLIERSTAVGKEATVTNGFPATKVAGNLSNRTIKLQLSFFGFL